ncbi:RnfABCDGE type electron transport complex subunit B [Geomonas propionica]|uniref:Ion-translocating oxidoreductase complex subunit B n=1 Tax=Geomonas propionica TaxID=2798582 RepID=A0ABS0YPH8_9BACT|nr:RnfABCDGE type electron transport complex subunit B [Geomonas propionica]MBJ6799793.1 RnfABCDGE type electron transport complex subunit B [Geomonas propionica]
MLVAVLCLAGLGGIFGIILGVASKKLAVEVDSRVEELNKVMPGANCGSCGLPGCAAFAEALVEGSVKPTLCAPGGASLYEKIALILGGEASEYQERQVAQLLCQGGVGHSRMLFRYQGIKECQAALAHYKGQKACNFGCVMQGSCSRACPFGAIQMGADGLPVVDYYLCTGCSRCVVECPQQILKLVGVSHLVNVRCVNPEPGKVSKGNCKVACIKCKICEKNCPEDAVHVVASGEGSVAIIDNDKCTNCGICAAKCPTRAIDKIPPLSEEVVLEVAVPPGTSCPNCGACKAA